MVGRYVFTLDEAIEMVRQEGLDIGNDVDFDQSDEGSITPDLGEAEFVSEDELGSESGDDELGSKSGEDELGSESGDDELASESGGDELGSESGDDEFGSESGEDELGSE